MSGRDQSADIEALIEDFQRSGLRELHLRADGTEIYLSAEADAAGLDDRSAISVVQPAATRPGPAVVASTPAASPTAPAREAAPDQPPGSVIVRAPYLGTFYRSPKPGSPVYVEIGSLVAADTELCLVEVMKLFTAVRAGTAGIVHSILAEDGQLVQSDQPLFLIRPA